MQLQQVDLAVIMPVGPGTNVSFAVDTLDSIYYYCHCSLHILVIDDSREGLGMLIREKHPDIEVLINKKSNGLAAGLYLTLSDAYRHLIARFNFQAMFKVDTDALVIGDDPQQSAIALFRSNAAIGLAGLYKTGNEITDFNGQLFDNRWPRNYMFDVTSTWKILKRPLANFTLRKYMKMAFRLGFNMGDNIFGGAYFMSRPLLVELENQKMLPDRDLKNSRMEEDHLFSVLAVAAGFTMADLAAVDLPFAMNWKKLPAAPETLLGSHKKVIHSTRSWENMDEAAIRAFFRRQRSIT